MQLNINFISIHLLRDLSLNQKKHVVLLDARFQYEIGPSGLDLKRLDIITNRITHTYYYLAINVIEIWTSFHIILSLS